jgi:hypothetical protein
MQSKDAQVYTDDRVHGYTHHNPPNEKPSFVLGVHHMPCLLGLGCCLCKGKIMTKNYFSSAFALAITPPS